LKRLLQVSEDEKQKLQDKLQAKDELLEKFQSDEELKKLSFTLDLETMAKVCSVNESACSFPSHQNDSFGASEKHTRGIGFNMITKMSYEGKGLGINGQGIVNLIEVLERHCYVGLGYGEDEV
jgi:hypothetical protein